jgi:hypothetical protein
MSNNFFIILPKTDKRTIDVGWLMLLETKKVFKWLLLSIYSDITLYLIRKNVFVATYRQI